MRERQFDVRSLLENPEPWALPRDLVREWYEAGPERLSPGEQTVFLAGGYIQETRHGGHEYWFGALFANYTDETAAALEALGMTGCASICRRSMEIWPDGELDLLADLDRELHRAAGREDDLEHCYRYMAANPGEFGIEAGSAPDPDEVSRRLIEARGTVPEADEFRPGTARVLLAAVPAVALVLGAIAVRGEALTFLRALGFVAGLVFLRSALLRLRLRVRMDPDGIRITGKPGVPWAAVTGCRLLRYALGPVGGFEIEYRGETGATRRVRVPRGIERYREALRMFLELASRHEAPWSAARESA